MKVLCKIFGHKWDKSNKKDGTQPCRRCSAQRMKMYSEAKHMMGENAFTWMIIE